MHPIEKNSLKILNMTHLKLSCVIIVAKRNYTVLVRVCMFLCFCVCFYTLTQKGTDPGT